MSHFSTVKTAIKRKSALVKALRSVNNGKWKNCVEVHEEAQNLYGYQNDMREQKAEIIIRRKHVGQSSNDIGFKQAADGTWQAIISDYDSSQYDGKWLEGLTQQYGKQTVIEVAEEQGFSWTEEVVGGEIYITCESSF